MCVHCVSGEVGPLPQLGPLAVAPRTEKGRLCALPLANRLKEAGQDAPVSREMGHVLVALPSLSSPGLLEFSVARALPGTEIYVQILEGLLCPAHWPCS